MTTKIASISNMTTESPGMLRLRRVLSEAEGPLSAAELADLACISYKTLTCCYRYILIRDGLMHVSAFERNPSRGPAIPMYSAGPLVGSPPKRPKRMPSAQRSKRWKERTGYLEYQKVLRAVAKPRDPIMAALTGGQQ